MANEDQGGATSPAVSPVEPSSPLSQIIVRRLLPICGLVFLSIGAGGLGAWWLGPSGGGGQLAELREEPRVLSSKAIAEPAGGGEETSMGTDEVPAVAVGTDGVPAAAETTGPDVEKSDAGRTPQPLLSPRPPKTPTRNRRPRVESEIEGPFDGRETTPEEIQEAIRRRLQRLPRSLRPGPGEDSRRFGHQELLLRQYAMEDQRPSSPSAGRYTEALRTAQAELKRQLAEQGAQLDELRREVAELKRPPSYASVVLPESSGPIPVPGFDFSLSVGKIERGDIEVSLGEPGTDPKRLKVPLEQVVSFDLSGASLAIEVRVIARRWLARDSLAVTVTRR